MAETVIDTLIVTLGLDPADFSKNKKEAAQDILKLRNDADRAAKDMAESGKRAAQFYANIKREALGAFAVITGANGLKNFTEQTVTNFAAMDRAAQSMGMNVSKLAAFQMMIVRNGGDAKAARTELQNLTKSMEEWKATGNTAMLPWLNRIGADANDDALGVFEKFAHWSEGKDAKLVNLVGGNLGFDQETINQAMKGQAAYRAEMEKSYKLGVPTEENIKGVTELQRKFFELRQSISGDGQAIIETMAPALANLLDLMVRADHAVPGLTTGILALTAAVTGLNSVKLGLNLLKLLGLGGAEKATEAAAPGVLSRMVGALGGPVALGLAISAVPTAANKGEAEDLKKAKASLYGSERSRARRPGEEGYDLDMAIRTLIGENGKSPRGMMDVAHVIKNRMNASGKGAADIVLANNGHTWQFEPWGDAATRNKLMGIGRDDPRYQAARKAWLDAMNEADPTGGATLFVSPKGQAAKGRKMPTFADASKMTMEREGHQFFTGGFWHGGAPSAPVLAQGPVTVNRNVTTGPVTIHTQASDAKGIARDFSAELASRQMMDQANTGLD